MSFLQILDTLFLGPLKLLFEVVYNLAESLTGNIGFSIIILSLVINLLILPLYMCADNMQERTRKREAELAPSIKHIKKTFTGDERMMMLQTFYKQNHYSPLSALSGAVSLLLEIPFFIAAYSFLSNVAEFQGASLWFLSDLSKPDGLLVIAGYSINVLPFVMTLFNVVASVLFLKGADLKSKIQLYAMALFFLIFLYTSPSGLLFYWTLNNLFSLIKNIFYKFKQPKTVLCYVISAIGVIIPICFFATNASTLLVRLLTLIITVLFQIPLAVYWLKRKRIIRFKNKTAKQPQPNKKIFLLGCAFISVLLGLLIPSALLADSPLEFYVSQSVHPVWYVVSSTCLAIGMFMLWFSVFYWLASPKGKVWFDKIIWILAIVMFVNYMFFGQNLGNLSASLQFDNSVNYSTLETALNIIVIIVLAVAMFFIATKFKPIVIGVLSIAIAAVGTMSTVNIAKAYSELNGEETTSSAQMPSFNLSKTGQNVVFIMLDRAMGQFVPYILKEKPELLDTYSGFTYYSNVISFGGHTNYASPALLGGYEYTPVELNKRSGDSLGTKQNEANLVIPRALTESEWSNGKTAKATIFEPMYTNYKFIGDLSVFDDYSDKIYANNILGKFVDKEQTQAIANNNLRNFFCFGLMKTMPLPLHFALYNEGTYNKVYSVSDVENGYYSIQTTDGLYKGSGIKAEFMTSYNNLVNLSTMTNIVSGSYDPNNANVENTYTFMCNNTTHEPMMLDATNNYTPPQTNKDEPSKNFLIDNTEYYTALGENFFTIDGKTLNMTNPTHMQYYQTNMAALLRVGEWLEYLKANGVYDNTRIIIASDHGQSLGQINELQLANGESAELYYPLLLVKDFGGTGKLVESTEFMTNADVPTLATQGVVANPVNKATNVPITNLAKTAHPQYICLGHQWSIYLNNGNQFDASKWASIDNTDGKGSIWNADDWKFSNGDSVLKEHSFD